MANPIILKETYPINDVGPNGLAVTIPILLPSPKRMASLWIINRGPDPVNYFIDAGVQAFASDSFFLDSGEYVVELVSSPTEFFAICGAGTTASLTIKESSLD